MASSPPTTALHSAPELDANEYVIQNHIEGARRHVKLVELFAALMLLLAGSLGYFLLAVLVDHWVISLTPSLRFLTMLIYVVGAAVFGWIFIAQLLMQRINPLYAANAIEQNAPSLKNSLVNFLFFREHRSSLQPAVFTTLQSRAAADLAAPNVDTTIDASKAIRIAYLLIAVLIVSAVYTIAAPKSAFQSLGRVINPWWQAAAPSRVHLDLVEPGDVSVYYGDYVVVRAAVSGKRETDQVVVIYSTADRQTVDVELPMKKTDDGLYFEATLPPDENGVHQDLSYHVRAGDAKSRLYHVKTNAAPSMVVDRVVYQFPPYANLPDRVEERQGDIRGLDGARVSIHARANRDIRSARIEFDPVDGEATTTLPMQVDGRKATVTFDLALNAKNEPARAAYQLRFLDEQGKRNPQPILHRIDVTRDFPPVVEILTPETRHLEVPLDAEQRIEIRAVDPDFELAKIGLNMVVGETEVFAETRQRAQRGQVVERFEFSPQRLKLSVGDTVTYRGSAEDNRADFDGKPRPNVEVTPRFTIVITEPQNSGSDSSGGEGEPNQQNRDGESNDGEPKETEGPDGKKDAEDSGDEKGTEKGTEKGDQKGDEKGDEKGDAKGDKSGGGGEQSDENRGDKETGDKETGDKETGDKGTGDKGTGEGDAGQGANGKADDMQPGEGDTQGGAKQGASGGAEPSDSGKPEQGKTDARGKTTGGGQPMGDSTEGENGVGDNGSASEGGRGGPSKAGRGGDVSNAEPNEALQDGDAIETIKEHIERSKGTRTGETVRSDNQADPGRAENETRGKPSGEKTSQLNQPDEGLPKSAADGNDPKSPGGGKSTQQAGSPSSQNPGGSSGGDDKAQSGDNTASDKPGAGAQESGGKAGQPKQDAAKQDPQQGQNGNHGAGKKNDATQGENGNTNKAQKQANDEGASETADSESGMGDSGQSGAGQKEESPMGAANQQGVNQDGKKSQRPDGVEDQTGADPQAPANSPKQSDTKGDQGGDRSGGGKQGGGQSAKQAGNDSAGSQSSADEGAGASSESGQGDKSGAAGSKQQGDKPTGLTGDQKGEGSQVKPGQGESPDGASSEAPQNQDPQPNGRSGTGQPRGGGVAPDPNQARNGARPVQEVADGAAANEQYARKATDMALDYLKHNPDDQALMDKLNWSEADRDRFLERWGKLKQSAREGDEGKRRLADAFEGLGLRRGAESMQRQGGESDAAGGLSQEGAGPANLPAHLLERFNAYKRGAAKSRK